MASLVLLLLFPGGLASFAGEPAFPEGSQQWDFRPGFGNAIPDSWNPPLFDYEIRMDGSPRAENRAAVFKSGVPNDPPRSRVVHRVNTEAERETLKQVLAGPSDPPAWVFTATGVTNAFDTSGISATAKKVFLWALNRTDAVQSVKRTQQALSGVIAIGGEVIKTEEIVPISGQKYLRMGWLYRIKVGDEVRVVPFAYIYSSAR